MISSLPAVIVPFNVALSCVIAVAARVATVGGVTTTGAAVVVNVIAVPSTVPVAVVANALNVYSVSAVKAERVAEIVVPVALTVVQSAAAVALYMNP